MSVLQETSHVIVMPDVSTQLAATDATVTMVSLATDRPVYQWVSQSFNGVDPWNWLCQTKEYTISARSYPFETRLNLHENHYDRDRDLSDTQLAMNAKSFGSENHDFRPLHFT